MLRIRRVLSSNYRRARAGVLISGALGLGLACGLAWRPGDAHQAVDWPVYGGNNESTKFSSLADINVTNIARLVPVWRWGHGDQADVRFGTYPGSFENTPLVIGNTLIATTPYNRVVALASDTGRELWSFDPEAYRHGQPPTNMGFIHRGVAALIAPGKVTLFLNSMATLYAIDAANGHLLKTFGVRGRVDLTSNLSRPIITEHMTQTSPPIVYGSLVIVGSGVPDNIHADPETPGAVQAFDAATGECKWVFNTIPINAMAVGAKTWDNDSWRRAGHVNVWAPMSVDDQHGLLYVPVSSPGDDHEGTKRIGQNLFSNSLVCLDALTGRMVWYFQIVHHSLWDYDLPTAPVLTSVHDQSGQRPIVAQVAKHGLLFVFDRLTGEPIWPVKEMAVPTNTDVDGEVPWATQPVPAKPAALSPMGFARDDLLDVTPNVRRAAERATAALRFGPVFTPPSREGTLQRPSTTGGVNWGGAAVDPKLSRLFVKVSTLVSVVRAGARTRGETLPPMTALPLSKPPYAELVAVDLESGLIPWRVPLGVGTTSIRHAWLAEGLALPVRIGSPGPSGPLVTAGGLVFVGGDTALYVFDSHSGEELSRIELGKNVSANPLTYRTSRGKQIVVIAAGDGPAGELVAMSVTQ